VPKLSTVATKPGSSTGVDTEVEKNDLIEEVQVNFAEMSARAKKAGGPRKPPNSNRNDSRV
jgi:hypothetical protein